MNLTNSSLLLQIAQPPLNVLTQTFITSIVAVLSVWVTGWNYLRIEKLKNERIDLQRQQRAYSVFIGRKYSLTQSTSSFFISNIQIAYYNYVHDLNSIYYQLKGRTFQEASQAVSDASIFKLAQDEIRDNKELLQEIAKERKRLWETIGLIQILFPKTDELARLIKQFEEIEENLENFLKRIGEEGNNIKKDLDKDEPLISLKPEQWYKAKNKQITDWRDTKMAETADLIEDLDSSLGNLIDYLGNEMDKK